MSLRRRAIALALAGMLQSAPAIADIGPADREPEAVRLAFHADRADPAFGSVDLIGLSAGTMASLSRDPPPDDRLRASFRVIVVTSEPSEPDNPAVFGQYAVMPDRVRFTPRFPPVPGVPYRAVVDLTALTAAPSPQLPPLDFSLARPAEAPPAHVERIYPSGDTLPANLLRLYIVFSAPMQRGHAQDQIRLIGRSGRPDPAAFYRSPVELWDPSMRRLTLLMDPGRVKRGVGPNRAIGAPLRPGRRYTLVVGRGMTDASGQQMPAAYSRSFKAAAAVRTAIDPRQWSVRSPAAGSRDALTVTLPIALDWALMARGLQVIGPDGTAASGRIAIDRHEHRWSIEPNSPWSAGAYSLRVDGSFEDVAGNTVGAPFDGKASGADRADAANPSFPPLRIRVDAKARRARMSN